MADTVKNLHEQAMSIAQSAMILRESGQYSAANLKYEEAFNVEKKAAFMVAKEKKSEPTRSILFRSAASLAYQAKLYVEASQMVGEGLSGYPPKRIFHELNLINEKIKSAIYNTENGLIPKSEGFVVHLVGNSIESGTIYCNDFLKRVEAMLKILQKTAIRLSGYSFSTRKDILIPSFHAPTGGSFSIGVSVTVRDVLVNPQNIIDEYLECFNLLENGNLDDLAKRIMSDEHISYFMSQSKMIAPDGDGVTNIDFIGKRRSVSLSKTPEQISLSITKNEIENNITEFMEIEGILNFASKRRGESLGIEDKSGKNFDIVVNEGLSEYVRNYFGCPVCVRGYGYDNKITRLDDIIKIDD
jgi:hypothetical protein